MSRFIALATICLMPLLSWADTVTIIEQKIHLENEVVQQIKEDLDQIVKPDLYKVSAVAKVSKGRTWHSEEVTREKNEQGPILLEEVLPGIKRPPAPKVVPTETKRSAVMYEQVFNLKSLRINLYLRDTIQESTASLIESYLQTSWVEQYPEIISVNSQRVPFPIDEDILKDAESKSGWKKILQRDDVLILLAALVLMLAFSLLLRRGIAKKQVTITNRVEKPEAKKKEDPRKQERINDVKQIFMGEILEQPVIARNFLKTLDPKQQAKVLGHFTNSYVRGLMSYLMNAASIEERIDEEVTLPDLQAVLQELYEYKEIRKKQLALPFGFLADLNPDELQMILSEEDTRTLGVILRFLPHDQVQHILSQLASAKQADLARQIQSPQPIDESTIATIEQRLRGHYGELSANLILAQHPQDNVIDLILDNSLHAPEIAKELIAQHPEKEEKYQQYLLDFDHFFSLDGNVLKRILGGTSNEILVTILCDLGEEEQKKIYKGISRERRHILGDMKKSLEATPTQIQINESKSKLLKMMRQTLYR
jgi:flagellar motor switch protein FliG